MPNDTTDPTPQDEAALARRRQALRRADLYRRGRMFVILAAAAAAGAIFVALATPYAGWSLGAAAVWFGARGIWLRQQYAPEAVSSGSSPGSSGA